MSFPTPYSTLLAADFTMEQALEQALLDTRASFPLFGDIPHVALSIASVEGPDDFRHAGVDFGRMFYSASLLKVAIPYCAYQLRTAVEDAGNATGATNAASTYAAARATIDPEAADAVPAIGPLKTGKDVFSEGSVIESNDSAKQFIVVWQNAFEADVPAMSFLVERTVRHFLDA
ncbi:hypothetical protein [Nocardia sp. NPDC057440]|uniref:hypothetical protein n=1 Tax=Nocardia sp. NPDC057440 TaxID=3346134 RepID=UPI00366A8FD6